MGMRAATGAVSAVHIENDALVCHVLGNVPPRGICGSGLVDAVAGALRLGLDPHRRHGSRTAHLRSCCVRPVKISQTDIRELQLAKGAIAAGIRLLIREFGVPSMTRSPGCSLQARSATTSTRTVRGSIGLLPFAHRQIHPSGNTALLGAKMALFAPAETFDELAKRIAHVSLSELEGFQDTYVDEMIFPGEEPEHTLAVIPLIIVTRKQLPCLTSHNVSYSPRTGSPCRCLHFPEPHSPAPPSAVWSPIPSTRSPRNWRSTKGSRLPSSCPPWT